MAASIVERPDVFDKGAFITVEYVTQEGDVAPYTMRCGTIVSAKDDLLIVDSEVGPEIFHIDLTMLTLNVDVVISRRNYGSDQCSPPGSIHSITLSRAPWENNSDDKKLGLELRVNRDEYEWISEGVFLYPPAEYFAFESPP